MNGDSVSAAVVNNNLTITSSRYGAAAQVTMNSGTALAALGFTGGESAKGTDVAGSFLVNGVTEAAIGDWAISHRHSHQRQHRRS